MDDGATGKVYLEIKFVWQPGGKGSEMSTRKCCRHSFIGECLARRAELRSNGKRLSWTASSTQAVLDAAPCQMAIHLRSWCDRLWSMNRYQTRNEHF
jgi:hypothetical protein